jgi:hypothetical protein
MWAWSIGSASKWSDQLFDTGEGYVPEWEILARLGWLCAGNNDADFNFEALDDGWFTTMCHMYGRDPETTLPLYDHGGPERMIDLQLRMGPWGGRYGEDPDGLNLQKVKDAVHGVDLGPMVPNRLSEVIGTPSGKIEQSKYFALPYGYNFITWRVEEIGLWSVQIAGWSGTQRTAWSSAKVVQIKTVQARQNNSSGTDCATKSGSEITVKYENGMVTFANPFSCAITVVISGQVNCRATWVPIPVSATFSMYSRESRSWGLGGVFPNALSTCVSYMKLAGLNYDGSGGLTMCANKACLSALTLTGRVS